jgi:alpha-1,2-mannosyltransferase
MAVETVESPVPRWLTARVQRCALFLMGALCFMAFLHTLRLAYQPGGNDFTVYLLAAQSLWEGSNPYLADLPFPYIYPLFLAFVFIPFVFIPYWLASTIWFALSVAGLAGACLMLQRLASAESGGTGTGRHLAAAGLIAILAIFQPIQSGLIEGQVNTIVLFCMAMFYGSYTRKCPLSAGAWLGAAIAIKVLPAVLLVFLLVRRQYRIMLWTLLCTVFLCTLPVIVAGRSFIAYYQSYLDVFLLPSMAHAAANCVLNFNLAGSLGCLLPTVPRMWLKIISGLLVAAGLLAIEATATRCRRPAWDIWCFCAYLIACPLLSPMVEIHHFVFAAPAVFLLSVKTIVDRSWATRAVVCSIVAFAACFDFMAECDRTRLSYFVGIAILLVVVFLANRRQHVLSEMQGENANPAPA